MEHTKPFTINLNQLLEGSFTLYVITLYLFVDWTEYNVISQICFLIFAALAVLKILICRRIYLHANFWLALSFVLFCFTSVFWSVSVPDALQTSVTLAQVFLLSVLVYHSFYDTGRLDVIIRAFYIAGLCMTAYAIFLYTPSAIFYALKNGIRLGAQVNNATNSFGMYCATTVLFSFYYFLYKRQKRYLLLAVFPFLLAMARGTRKALVIIAMGIFLLIVLKNGFQNVYRTLLILAVVGVLFYLLLQLPLFEMMRLRMIEMFSTLFGQDKVDASTLLREKYIKIAMAGFREKPLLGYGINNFRALLASQIGRDTYAHNNFAELLCDTGIVGFALYYSMYAYSIAVLFRRLKEKDPVRTIVFLFLLITVMIDYGGVTYYDKTTWIYFALGFLACSGRREAVPEENGAAGVGMREAVQA